MTGITFLDGSRSPKLLTLRGDIDGYLGTDKLQIGIATADDGNEGNIQQALSAGYWYME